MNPPRPKRAGYPATAGYDRVPSDDGFHPRPEGRGVPAAEIKDSISRGELKKIAEEQFGQLVKAVVDVEQEIMAVGGELHADEEVLLTELEGSKREYTWGINLYPEKTGNDFVEFDSMVNLKPHLKT